MEVQERRGKISWQENTPCFGLTLSMKEKKKTFRFKRIDEAQSVLQWWITDGTDWPMLRDLAIWVFSMAASAAAASEHNFSTFGFIHSKLGDRLAPEKVKKLVYIKTNAIQMEGTSCYVDDLMMIMMKYQ